MTFLDKLAELPLTGIRREFPHTGGPSLGGPGEERSPREMHPAFYGCYDWHSAVHSHWALVRLLRGGATTKEAEIVEMLSKSLTAENIAGEVAFFNEPMRKSFERPYGWAWLLELSRELGDYEGSPRASISGGSPKASGTSPPPSPELRRTGPAPSPRPGEGNLCLTWAANLQPLTDLIAGRYLDWLPNQTYPIRYGIHGNTAFGLIFALDFARETSNRQLEECIVENTMRLFGDDRDASIHEEPSGADFLSPSLTEAHLMSKVLDREEFGFWFDRFLPGVSKRLPTPAVASDPTDGQICHLIGLNLSRAWSMGHLARLLDSKELQACAGKHLEAGNEAVFTGDYMGDHWLASFALLAAH